MVNPVVRLDADMEKRRLELKLEWRDVAERSGLTYETLRAMRRTGRASALSKALIESALAWEAGSIDSILQGGQAVVVAVADPPADSGHANPQAIRQQIAELRDEIRHLDPLYERNRPHMVEHLERRIAELQSQLDVLNHG